MSKVYITTTLPYVNADPHIGFALELAQADVIARYYRAKGDEVFFNFGTDEHGQKVYEKSLEEKKSPQELCDFYAENFKNLVKLLNLSETNFIRTTDVHHVMAAQEFWKRSLAAGDIYKKNYQTKYCVGCELEKQDSDLENGKCPLHPTRDIELISEENYFFKFSKYEQKLLDLYESNPKFFVPNIRFNEVRAFVKSGLQDFSISRLKAKMPWGIDVPGDSEHVMYVWFDALVNYISAVGWPDKMKEFNAWWPVIQFCGKDQGRQQAVIWQAMLMSAGLPASKQIVMHGFITGGGGQKMSKSVGNVVNPLDIVNEYSTDALRYYLLREMTPFEDGDFTMELFKNAYNANLANGLGNLVSRIMKMSEEYLGTGHTGQSSAEAPEDCPVNAGPEVRGETLSTQKVSPLELLRVSEFLDNYEFKKAFDVVFDMIQKLDQRIQSEKPFTVWKTDQEAAKKIVRELVSDLRDIAFLLHPFMPQTAEKIATCIKENKKPAEPLFLRKE